MARLLGKPLGKVIEKYNDLTRDSAGVLTSPLNKLWRAKLLLDRATSTLPKDTAYDSKMYNPNGPASQENYLASSDPRINEQLQYKRRLKLRHGDTQAFIKWEDTDDPAKSAESKINQRKQTAYQNYQGIQGQNQVIIYNLSVSPYKYLILQNRPPTIDFRGETTWATIKSMGRNTPMYHYTGSEDILQFNISWYSENPQNAADVISKCRLLEAWTKSDGYQKAPPILRIEWGTSEMFSDHYYILTSATYSLNNFNSFAAKSRDKDGQVVDKQLFPSTATQELIFKRVSSYSLSYADILFGDPTLKSN